MSRFSKVLMGVSSVVMLSSTLLWATGGARLKESTDLKTLGPVERAHLLSLCQRVEIVEKRRAKYIEQRKFELLHSRLGLQTPATIREIQTLYGESSHGVVGEGTLNLFKIHCGRIKTLTGENVQSPEHSISNSTRDSRSSKNSGASTSVGSDSESESGVRRSGSASE